MLNDVSVYHVMTLTAVKKHALQTLNRTEQALFAKCTHTQDLYPLIVEVVLQMYVLRRMLNMSTAYAMKISANSRSSLSKTIIIYRI